MTKSEDRRRHRRVSTRAGVRIAAGDGARDGETRDVSEGGVGVVSAQKLERGAQVDVEVMLDLPTAENPSSLRTMATVMWSAETDTGAYVAGLQFDGPSEADIERLRRFLASVDEPADE
jgi:c-di-GMP-binding flagellar brake protein YcgR